MNRTILIVALALIPVSALIMIGNIAIQSAQACPSSGAVAPNGNPDASNTLNTQPRSQIATSESA
jgi:hypothetical protein